MDFKTPFNHALLAEWRQKENVKRPDLARRIGISANYMGKIESGERVPSGKLLRALSSCTGIPMEEFFSDDEESMNACSAAMAGDVTKILNDLKRERYNVKTMRNKIAELTRQWEHAVAINAFQAKYIAILTQDIPTDERIKKTVVLARDAVQTGEIRFAEVQAALGISRAQLKQWLESEKREYRCKLFEDKNVMAATPTDAGVDLGCFDCDARAEGDCLGFSDTCYPENIFALIATLEAGGFDSREKQAKLLRDAFSLEITPHYLSEIISRQKRGKSAPDDIVNLKPNIGR